MKRSFLPWIAAILVLISMPYCKKKKTDSCSSEAALVIATTPASGSTEAPAPGPTFPLRVSISSAIPAGGVSIEVKAHPEGSTTNFYTETRNSTTKDNDFTITNAPSTVVCVVEITVTSKACTNNKTTASYRFSRK